jgi:hypothetical protein
MLCRVALVRTEVSEEEILRSVLRLLVTANVVPSLPTLVTLMMEAIRSQESSILITATWRNVPKDGILHLMYCLILLSFYFEYLKQKS